MVDATISMLLQRLAPLIENKVREEACLLINSKSTKKQTKNLFSKLKTIQNLLQDAESKRVIDPKVKTWLQKLENISYEIEDVLDEEGLRNFKLKHDENSSSFIESRCLCFKQVVDRRSIFKRIKKINRRLNSIAKENEDEFKFIPNIRRDYREFKRVESTSFVDVSEVHGRDSDAGVLVSKLLEDNNGGSGNGIKILSTVGPGGIGRTMEDNNDGGSGNGIKVLSAVGPGGIGKTTLAQLVYNDKRVKNHFQHKIWICVSHPFDGIKICKAILEYLNKNTPNLSQFETLLQCIKEATMGKKILLVLDDVWTEDDTMWDPLKIALSNCESSSRVLVTTRKVYVAQIMGTKSSDIHHLHPLSDSDCWSLLSQRAFAERRDEDLEALRTIGREIVKKCKGLPLAAKIVGSFLRFKRSVREWEKVLQSEMWELDEVRTDLFPLLLLSFDELRPEVKRCFSCCAVFPKDSVMEVDRLIQYWMAHDLLASNGSEDEMETKGREYFDDLAARSFFQDFDKDEKTDGRVIRCKMHDIVHDFARFLTENECLILDSCIQREVYPNARYVNICEPNAATSLVSICNPENLRTLFCTKRVPRDLVGSLKRVRLLSLMNCELHEMPREIGKLIHLRCLDLSLNPIQRLPDDICNLYKLQTLGLEFCHNLKGLPKQIHRLKKLRHLLNVGTPSKFEFSNGCKELTALQTLNQFYATKECNNLEILKDLNQIQGCLRVCIAGLDREDDIVKAENSNLKDKKLLTELQLHCAGKIKFQVIEALHAPPNLQILEFAGLYMPKWIENLTNLKKLTIRSNRFANLAVYREIGGSTCLPPLGELPFLEQLNVEDMFGMQKLGNEFLGINVPGLGVKFPRLKRLSLMWCSEWIEWEDISEEDEENSENLKIMPCLEHLLVLDCMELQALPHRLLRKASSLEYLNIMGSTHLLERYDPETGQDRDKVSHIRQVSTFDFWNGDPSIRL